MPRSYAQRRKRLLVRTIHASGRVPVLIRCLGNSEVAPASYNLILANASMLQAEIPATEDACVRLVWAQLLLAFRYISLGGSLVLSLDTRPHDWVVDIITVLIHSFDATSIKVIQPRNHNFKRPMAYIVCSGYGSNEHGGPRNLFIGRLRDALRSRHDSKTIHSQNWSTALDTHVSFFRSTTSHI